MSFNNISHLYHVHIVQQRHLAGAPNCNNQYLLRNYFRVPIFIEDLTNLWMECSSIWYKPSLSACCPPRRFDKTVERNEKWIAIQLHIGNVQGACRRHCVQIFVGPRVEDIFIIYSTTSMREKIQYVLNVRCRIDTDTQSFFPHIFK